MAQKSTAFVGNLPFDIVERDLEDFFRGLPVRSVRLIRDRESSRLRGYGFVEFDDEGAAREAVKFDGKELHQRALEVQLSQNPPRPAGSGRPPRGGRGGSRGGPRGGSRGGGYRGSGGGYRDEYRGGGGYRDDYRGGGGFRDDRGYGGSYRDDYRGGYRDDYRGGGGGGYGGGYNDYGPPRGGGYNDYGPPPRRGGGGGYRGGYGGRY